MKKWIAIALTTASLTVGCKGPNVIPPTQCVLPPPSKIEGDAKRLIDLSAKLDKLPVTVDLKTDFSTVVKAEFGTVKDDIAALTVFCNAINCYIKQGKTGQELAKQMFQLLRDWWDKQTRQQGGGGDSWSAQERQAINSRPDLAPQIFSLGETMGVR